MFTGIVLSVGCIEAVTPLKEALSGTRLRIHVGTLDTQDMTEGDSIAINGACMTIVKLAAPYFEVDVSNESLRLTTGLNMPGKVNLEKALCLSDRLGGHLVSGHIDGLGTVSHFSPVGESYLLRVIAPKHLAKYLAYKGSIAVNGVSLTVNTVKDVLEGCEFSINLIPYTLAHTTLQNLCEGDAVNLEVDMIARYVDRMCAPILSA